MSENKYSMGLNVEAAILLHVVAPNAAGRLVVRALETEEFISKDQLMADCSKLSSERESIGSVDTRTDDIYDEIKNKMSPIVRSNSFEKGAERASYIAAINRLTIKDKLVSAGTPGRETGQKVARIGDRRYRLNNRQAKLAIVAIDNWFMQNPQINERQLFGANSLAPAPGSGAATLKTAWPYQSIRVLAQHMPRIDRDRRLGDSYDFDGIGTVIEPENLTMSDERIRTNYSDVADRRVAKTVQVLGISGVLKQEKHGINGLTIAPQFRTSISQLLSGIHDAVKSPVPED